MVQWSTSAYTTTSSSSSGVESIHSISIRADSQNQPLLKLHNHVGIMRAKSGELDASYLYFQGVSSERMDIVFPSWVLLKLSGIISLSQTMTGKKQFLVYLDHHICSCISLALQNYCLYTCRLTKKMLFYISCKGAARGWWTMGAWAVTCHPLTSISHQHQSL